MDLSERQAEIAELVREHGFLSVDSLSARYEVTTQTIRRDLNTLCDRGRKRFLTRLAPDDGPGEIA